MKSNIGIGVNAKSVAQYAIMSLFMLLSKYSVFTGQLICQTVPYLEEIWKTAELLMPGKIATTAFNRPKKI
jgi:hypothetical protein